MDDITEVTVYSASQIAAQLGAKMVICASTEGETASNALEEPDICSDGRRVSSSEATLRRMCLYWGVIPLAGRTYRRREGSARLCPYTRQGYQLPSSRAIAWYSSPAHPLDRARPKRDPRPRGGMIASFSGLPRSPDLPLPSRTTMHVKR